MSGGGFPIGPRHIVRQPMRSLGIAASGLSAQRTRLDVISENIANAETTRGVDGTPYRRKVVQLQEVAYQPTDDPARPAVPADPDGFGGVAVSGIAEDTTAGPSIYDPGHPDADENGYVRMPNVDINTEIVDLMETRRLFEANASVFQAVKQMLHRSTQL